jgi:AcrR family transcriptional regulator
MAARARQAAKSAASMSRALEAALELFSTQGYGATTMRQIAERADLSVGNLYHHFTGKEEIFQQLIDGYWRTVLDPDLWLNKVFARADFPDDLEEMSAAIEEVVEDNSPHILLVYVDVIEFGGKHIRAFYESMAERFRKIYGRRFAERGAQGEFGDADPMVAVMLATRWLFYFFTVEKCFGVPMHFGMKPEEAVHEFIRLIRYGLLPRARRETESRQEKPRERQRVEPGRMS